MPKALARAMPPGDVSLASADFTQPHWYAVYTRANHEKQVAQQLALRSIEHFLPTYETVRRWKDRRVQLKMPLFPGYVFIHHPMRDRLRVLQIPSVVRLVGFSGRPTPLADAEMEALRQGLTRQSGAKPHPFLTVGRLVRIVRGPLERLEGILVRRKGSLRVVISLKLILRSIVVDIDTTDIAPID